MRLSHVKVKIVRKSHNTTFMNVLWVDAKLKMGGMFVISLTKETGSHVGEKKPLLLLIMLMMWMLLKNMIRDGSITTEFQWIGKGKMTYSSRKHTKAEAQ